MNTSTYKQQQCYKTVFRVTKAIIIFTDIIVYLLLSAASRQAVSYFISQSHLFTIICSHTMVLCNKFLYISLFDVFQCVGLLFPWDIHTCILNRVYTLLGCFLCRISCQGRTRRARRGRNVCLYHSVCSCVCIVAGQRESKSECILTLCACVCVRLNECTSSCERAVCCMCACVSQYIPNGTCTPELALPAPRKLTFATYCFTGSNTTCALRSGSLCGCCWVLGWVFVVMGVCRLPQWTLDCGCCWRVYVGRVRLILVRLLATTCGNFQQGSSKNRVHKRVKHTHLHEDIETFNPNATQGWRNCTLAAHGLV